MGLVNFNDTPKSRSTENSATSSHTQTLMPYIELAARMERLNYEYYETKKRHLLRAYPLDVQTGQAPWKDKN